MRDTVLQTPIDLDEPLGDAGEVYGREIVPETSFRLESKAFRADHETDYATLRVDDIFKGEVALFTGDDEDGGVSAGTLSQLSPSEARELANILLRAADYAEDQL